MNNVLTEEEWRVFGDRDFFLKKATISAKLKQILEQLHLALQPEINNHQLLAPDGFNCEAVQFVKGGAPGELPLSILRFPSLLHSSGQTRVSFALLVGAPSCLCPYCRRPVGQTVSNEPIQPFLRGGRSSTQLESRGILVGMECRTRIHFKPYPQPSFRNGCVFRPSYIFQDWAIYPHS